MDNDNPVQISTADLIQYAYEQKPIEFRQTFDALISDKLTTAIGDKKIEVAQSMFKPAEPEDTESEPETEEVEDQDEIT